MVCKLYVALCRKVMPGGLTLSALAHLRAQAGHPWWRDRLDGICLLLWSDHQHCQTQYQRDTRANHDA